MAGHRWATAGAIAALVVAGLMTAFAAGLAVDGGPLASGRADILPCDGDGVGVVQRMSGTDVASVDVTGIATDCAGGGVRVTVRNGSAQSSGGPVTVPAGGGTVNVTVSPTVPLTDSHSVSVLILGS